MRVMARALKRGSEWLVPGVPGVADEDGAARLWRGLALGF